LFFIGIDMENKCTNKDLFCIFYFLFFSILTLLQVKR